MFKNNKYKLPYKYFKNILTFLNKEYDFNILGSIISIITQSFAYTILISYIIYNLIVTINPNPYPDNLLKINYSIYDSYSVNIITDFDEVVNQYLKFISGAVTLDFGKVDVGNEDRFPIIIGYLSNTLFFLIGGLLMSLILSIILIFISYYSILKKTVVELVCKLSYLHLAMILWLIDGLFRNIPQFDINNTSFPVLILFGSFFVSLGSGILADYYNLLKEEYDNIMRKDYVVFAKDSGLNYYYFAFKELLFNLINISISRIPIIFGGLVIIEYYI